MGVWRTIRRSGVLRSTFFWAAVVLLLINLVIWIFFPQLVRKNAPVSATYTKLDRVDTFVRIYVQGKLSPVPKVGNRDSLTSWLREVGAFEADETLVDGWGRPFIFRVNPHREYGIELYSAGPNGRDEGGRGDDITVSGLAPPW